MNPSPTTTDVLKRMEAREEGRRLLALGHIDALRRTVHSFGLRSVSECPEDKIDDLIAALKQLPEPELGTFAAKKRLRSYRSVAVIVADATCDRVVAYHSSLQDALETEAKYPNYKHAAVYVRHDKPLPPIAGDYQI